MSCLRFAVGLLIGQAGKSTNSFRQSSANPRLEMEEGKAYQIEARPKDTVKTLKAVLNLELGFAEQAIQLSFDGKVLSDEMELTEVDLKEGSKLQMEVVEVTEEAVSSSSGEGDAWNQPTSFIGHFTPRSENYIYNHLYTVRKYMFKGCSGNPRLCIYIYILKKKKNILRGIQGRHSDFHQSGLSRQDHQADFELGSRGGD